MSGETIDDKQRAAIAAIEVPLLTAQEIAKLLQVSDRTVWQWVEKNEFPKPIRLSQRKYRWFPHQVKSFINERRTGEKE
ncbi:helix-turn-helix transcriptional regulator [Planctomycetaceae bacterium SH139]